VGADDAPDASRRRFMHAAAGLGTASVAGLAAACASGTGGEAAGPGHGMPAGRGLANTVLEAFKTHRLVGMGEAHELQNHHDALTLLLTDPRLPGVVDDIVVEFGNALYQDTIDRFISGQPVDNADLRLVWRNTTQSPLQTWDSPVYEQFFRTVRAVNAPLSPRRQIRVLLGDPPLDWSKIANLTQLRAIAGPQRDTHPASVIETQVLARGRRALVCYGLDHLTHGGSLAGNLERAGERPTLGGPRAALPGGPAPRPYLIADFLPAAGDPGELARRFSRYSPGMVIPAAGTWLGSADAGLFFPAGPGPHGRPQASDLCGFRLGSLIDAALYLGPPESLTASSWNPAIFLDPAYWRELQRRSVVKGNIVNLQSYRQERPARYPLVRLPPSQECGQA
jgi:hypothetical protein